ncbi:MAG: hypothetical protein RL033_5254 [Pseudomonadota bacterium]
MSLERWDLSGLALCVVLLGCTEDGTPTGAAPSQSTSLGRNEPSPNLDPSVAPNVDPAAPGAEASEASPSQAETNPAMAAGTPLSGMPGTAPGGAEMPTLPEEPGAAPPVDTSLKVLAPSDANITYWGRVDLSDPTVATYAAPGVTVTVRFRGEAIAVLLGDEFRYGNERGFHDVLVDGQLQSPIALQNGTDRYAVASGLGPGEHSVSLVKRTQAQLGKALFRGFEINGEVLPPAPAPSLAIEFIGDSITAGEGVEGANGSAECGQNALGQPGGWGQPVHNANRSYGVVAARALNAEFQLTAVSGIGLVRNYSQMYDARTMPDVYDLMFAEEMASIPWDHARYTPDVVVVALGTNDFSPGDAPADQPRAKLDVGAYTDAYVQFVSRLRGLYPEAEIFALTSQLLSDGSPDASYRSATDLQTAVTNVAQRLNTQGDSRVHSFVTMRVSGLGCSGHPNVQQSEQLGLQLATEIRSVLGL